MRCLEVDSVTTWPSAEEDAPGGEKRSDMVMVVNGVGPPVTVTVLVLVLAEAEVRDSVTVTTVFVSVGEKLTTVSVTVDGSPETVASEGGLVTERSVCTSVAVEGLPDTVAS